MGRLPGPLVLASESPQRRKLLKKLGIPFEIVPSHASESTRETNPRRLVARLALRKARAVAARRRGAVVLGSDTVVVCAGRVIGKPRGPGAALAMLRLLNGRWQRVYTGIALVAPGGRELSRVIVSRVKARRLPEPRLRQLAGKHLDKAGAYAVQDRRDPFIARIVGGRDNVIGLPVSAVRALLRKL